MHSIRTFCLMLILILLLMPYGLHGQQTVLHLHQIGEMAESHSQEWRQISERLSWQVSRERSAASRLNPELGYDLEFMDSSAGTMAEHSLYLQKPFRTPAHWRNLNASTDGAIHLLEREYEMEQARWMADMRFGFIRISLADRLLGRLRSLSEEVRRLGEIAVLQTGEPGMTGLDRRLLQMTVFQLQAEIHQQQAERDRLLAEWRSRMGLDPDTGSELVFEGNFEELRVLRPDSGWLGESRELRAHHSAVQAAALRTDLERSRRWPSVGLSAGYKQIDTQWRGFLLGVSLPLPLLNANRHAVEEAASLERLARAVYDQAELRLRQDVSRRQDNLVRIERELDRLPDHLPEEPEMFVASLTEAWREGVYSLNDVLNALRLMADTWQTGYGLLESYFRDLTELEAMTGQELVNP